jgi:ABC-type branched-subunit amino acid transport system substrate-binding protein
VLLGLLAACGSTSKTAKKAKAKAGENSNSTDSSVAPGDTTGATDAAAAATGATPGGTPGKGGPSTGTGTGGNTSGSGPGGGRGPLPLGIGATATEVKVGVEVTIGLNAAITAVGGKANTTDETLVANTVAAWINKHGGVAGRKLVLVIHGTDKTSGTWASQAQTTCSDFAEDKKVFAVVSSTVGGNDSLAACLAQHKTPLIEQNFWPYDREAYSRWGSYLFQPSRAVPERWTRAYVDGLIDQGFFDKGAKIGLIKYNAPQFLRIADAIKARLKERGLSLTEEASVVTPQSVSDFGQMNAQLSNTILRFRSSNVSHIVFAEYNGIVPFFLLPQAESQGYHPRYGFSSIDLPNTQQGNAPAAQLKRSVVIGWLPPEDIQVTDDKRGGNAALCLKMLRDAGVGEPSRLYTQSTCDSLLFLKAALDRATALTPPGLQAAVESLGTSFDSAFTWAARYGPGRHDGADAVRPSKFEDQCGCYRLTGPPRSIA